MRIVELQPPRTFRIGRGVAIEIRDCGRIWLDADEQVTFETESGTQYDVARKSWGYYATPSTNGRLINFRLRAVLGRSLMGKYYVFLVEQGAEADFERYLRAEELEIVRWLDNDADLAAIPVEAASSSVSRASLACVCGSGRLTTVHMVRASHRREVFHCGLCGHYVIDDGAPSAAPAGTVGVGALAAAIDPRQVLETAAKESDRIDLAVPDGERAAARGFDRPEFQFPHRHVFSAASLALLAAHAGLDLTRLERTGGADGFQLTARLVAGRPSA